MPETVALTVHTLPNGLRLEIYDTSRHYFGGYWRISLQARCLVPLAYAALEDIQQLEDVRRQLGDPVTFERTIEQMAVPLGEVEQVRAVLLERLTGQMIPLLGNPRFPERFIASEYRQRLKRALRGIPCLA